MAEKGNKKPKESKLKQNKTNKANKGKIIRIVSISLFSLITVFALIYFGNNLISTQKYFDNESSQIAQQITASAIKNFENSSSNDYSSVNNIANAAKGVTNRAQLENIANKALKGNKSLVSVQFLDSHTAISRYGNVVGSSSDSTVWNIVESKKNAVSGMYQDSSLGATAVAVYSPVENNEDIDGVIGYFSVKNIVEGISVNNKKVSYYAITKQDGIILKKKGSSAVKADNSTNIYDYINDVCNSKEDADTLLENIKSGITSSLLVTIEGKKYNLTNVALKSIGDSCSFVTLIPQDSIINTNFTAYNAMLSSAIFLSAVIIFCLIALVIVSFQTQEKIDLKAEYDPIIGSNTYKAFYMEAEKILKNSKISKFAVVSLNINKFSYIRQQFGSDVSTSILKYTSNIIKKMIGNNECYGNISDDSFVILLHYTEEQELYDRLRVLEVFVANCEDAISRNISPKLSIGICFTNGGDKEDINTLADHASIAKTINNQRTGTLYDVYDSNTEKTYNSEAEIEAKMEKDLENRRFKLFFQPKYNIQQDVIDSAEVLVRWYDEQKKYYIPPDKFIGIFEVNGFIVNMDRYVFEQSCEFLKTSIERGEKTVPLSVNVSRVSAIQNDFVEHYVSIKKKYNIPDNYITLEFTESFAMENIATLSNIVTNITQNGFLVSIDDFGSGYSSFTVLKELQVHELKLDKTFLTPGKNQEKDQLLISTIIKLGKDFGMKVVQEGVETLDELNEMKEYGCDVIQGYYYSKPLMMSDFIEFLNRDTSFRSIAEFHQHQIKQKSN